MRKLPVLLMLACAGVQPALGSSLAASALTLGIYASHPHAHSVALQSDGDHLDVVLSHPGREAREPSAAPRGADHPASFSEGDHVVHIAGSDAASTAARRAIPDQAPALSVAAVLLPAVSNPQRAPRLSQGPRARGVDHLRTVVLRL